MMRKIMVAFLLLGAVIAKAQTNTEKQKVHKTPEQKAESQVVRLTKKLNLTSDQQVAIKDICLASTQKMEALKDTKLTSDERKAQMKQIETEKESLIKAKLTTEQNVKYDDMKAKMEQRRQERMAKRKTKTE